MMKEARCSLADSNIPDFALLDELLKFLPGRIWVVAKLFIVDILAIWTLLFLECYRPRENVNAF